MNKIALTVDKRSETGKGQARRLRASGKAPAVFYGRKTDSIKLIFDVLEFRKAIEQAGTNPIFELKIRDDGTTMSRSAILKERQIRPLDGTIFHIDFLEVFMDESIEVTVPIEFEGKPVGIDKGGLFQVASRELRISCLPDDIPSVITVDVTSLDVGQSIHVGQITLPKGVSVLQDEGVALATVATPKKSEEEVAEVAETEQSE